MRKSFIVVPGHDATIGNLSEKFYYALFKAKRTHKKVRFIRKKFIFFDAYLRKKLGYKQVLALYCLKGSLIETKFFWINWVVGIFWGGVFWLYIFWGAICKKLKIIKKFRIKLFGFGEKDLFNIEQQKKLDFNIIKRLSWKEFFAEKPELYFSKKNEELCRRQLRKIGIQEGQWYVCLHIRTGAFHKAKDEYRNANIENYLEAIDYIRSKGGVVIRLGDAVKLGAEDHYIDYPNTPMKSELMDLFLIKNCRFYLGTNSGVVDTAFLFGVPVIIVNMTDLLFGRPYKKNDIFIYKRFFSKRQNKILSFLEVFKEPLYVNSALEGEFLNEFLENYQLIENTPEDIKDVVVEMFGNLDFLPEESFLQKKFMDKLNEATVRWLQDECFQNKYLDNAYRILTKVYFFNGRIGRVFSEKYLE